MQRCCSDFTAGHREKAAWSGPDIPAHARPRPRCKLLLVQPALGFCASPAQTNTRFKAGGLLQTQARRSALSVSEGEPRQLPQLCKSWSSSKERETVPVPEEVLKDLTPAANTLMPQSAQREIAAVDPLRAAGVRLESTSRISHGNLQRINVSAPVSCRYERNNSCFFTLILSLKNSPGWF